MKFVSDRAFANPDAAARKLMDLANAFEPVQDGRIYIEKINGPFIYELKGTPAEYKVGLLRAIEKGWLELHESGTFGSPRRVRRCSPERRKERRMCWRATRRESTFPAKRQAFRFHVCTRALEGPRSLRLQGASLIS
jgi:hypothetical protein